MNPVISAAVTKNLPGISQRSRIGIVFQIGLKSGQGQFTLFKCLFGGADIE